MGGADLKKDFLKRFNYVMEWLSYFLNRSLMFSKDMRVSLQKQEVSPTDLDVTWIGKGIYVKLYCVSRIF